MNAISLIETMCASGMSLTVGYTFALLFVNYNSRCNLPSGSKALVSILDKSFGEVLMNETQFYSAIDIVVAEHQNQLCSFEVKLNN